MMEAVSKKDKRKYIFDLVVIGIVSATILLIYGFLLLFLKIDLADMPLLLQVLIGSFMEYGLMGLGITIVCIYRKESFCTFGLKNDKLLLTIGLSILPCLPELFKTMIKNSGITYFPFQGVNYTKHVLSSGFPVNVIGMVLIIMSWGFFEGFTYTVIWDRINKLLPSKYTFLNWGPLSVVFYVY